MARNAERIPIAEAPNPPETPDPAPTAEQPLTVNIPVNFVELPSAGRFYADEHPLYSQPVVEIKFMTTREEEILNSPTLVRRGLAIDRLIQSLLIDKKIKVQSLLIGDKNAILVAARSDAYGSDYNINVTCPICTERDQISCDLEELSHKELADDVEINENRNVIITLPRTKAKVELRFLTGQDEEVINKFSKKGKKYKMENNLSLQYKQMIVSINGDPSRLKIAEFIDKMPAFDSRYLRTKYQEIAPDVDLGFDFYCQHCGEEQRMEVPITVNFFWP